MRNWSQQRVSRLLIASQRRLLLLALLWLGLRVPQIYAGEAATDAGVASTPTAMPKSDAVLPRSKEENKWGPFEGRVVDAETGAGIMGAAVIVFWRRSILNPVQSAYEFFDAHWAVTDKDGRFTVPR